MTPAVIEGAACGFDLGGEALGAVAGDGFADFGESGAGGALDVGYLGGSALEVAVLVVGLRGVCLDEAPGELGFEDDDGERMAEDIMEVAGDAFAFRDGGEGDVLFWAARSRQSARFCWAKKMLPPPTTIAMKIAM